MRRDRYAWATLAIWGVAVVAMLLLHAHGIAARAYPDMDDQLRLVEVRDWLGGQGFRDLHQYRLNPDGGPPMHWSRLVDMPIAATILLLRPWLGASGAELAATVAVPMLTLGGMLIACGEIARRLGGDDVGLAATALTGFAVTATVQAQPLRIDHHGWEIALSLIAVLGALDPRPARGGTVAAIGSALALQISLEALPFAAAVGAVFGIAWCLDPRDEHRTRLTGYALWLAAGEGALFALLRARSDWGGYCDAISPPHLLALTVAAAGVLLATRIGPARTAARVLSLALTGIAAIAAYRAVPPHCGADAFAALEPIVRVYWYDQVKEGLPVWRQAPLTAVETIGFPLIGIGCAIAGLRVAAPPQRRIWATYLPLLIAASVVALLVQRAGGLANALAVPAAAWATARLVARAQAHRLALARIFGSVAAVLALNPIAPLALAGPLLAQQRPAPAKPAEACDAPAAVHRLAALPPARLLAPFDLGPAILLQTRHAVLASGHHRNHAAMADELRAWMGDDATAHAILHRHRIDLVLSCDLGETALYRQAAPMGLAAQLATGRAPAWLMPVPLPGAPFRVWRVVG